MPNCGYQTFSFRFLGACILRALLYFFPSALSGPLGPGSKTEEELKNRGWFAGGDSGLFHISTQALSDRAPAGVAKAAPWCALPWFQCTHLVVWSWWFFINIRILYPWDLKSRLGFPREFIFCQSDMISATGIWQYLYDHGTENPRKTRGNTVEKNTWGEIFSHRA